MKVHLLIWSFAVSIIAAMFSSVTVWHGNVEKIFSGSDTITAWSTMSDYEHIAFIIWICCVVCMLVTSMQKTNTPLIDFVIAILVETAFFVGYLLSQFDIGAFNDSLNNAISGSAVAVLTTNMFVAAMLVNCASIFGLAWRWIDTFNKEEI